MAITLVESKTGGAAGSNVTLTFATSLLQNDVVVVFGARSTANNPSIVTSGYTTIGTSEPLGGAFYKRMGASPDTNVVCTGESDAFYTATYVCFVLRGVDTTTAEDATATTATATSTNPDAPSITTVTNNAWVIAFAGMAALDSAVTVPSGYSNHATLGTNGIIGDTTVAGCTFEKTTAGAENPPSWTDWLSGTWKTYSIALRPAGAGWANISKINGVASSSIAKVNDVAVASISKVNGVAV